MYKDLGIENAAARGIQLFDVFRDVVLVHNMRGACSGAAITVSGTRLACSWCVNECEKRVSKHGCFERVVEASCARYYN